MLASLAAARASTDVRGLGSPFELRDQFGQLHTYSFPRDRISVLAFADRKGSDQLEAWIRPLYEKYGEAVDIRGVARLRGVPSFAQGLVRRLFRRHMPWPVLMDWTGNVSEDYAFEARRANLVIVDRDGRIAHRVAGEASAQRLDDFFARVDRLLAR